MAAWFALAALQGLTTAYSGMQQRNAAQEANKLRDKIAKQQFERQLKEYEIGWGQELMRPATRLTAKLMTLRWRVCST